MAVDNEKNYAVLLYGERIGTLKQKGDHTRFSFDESYLDQTDRPVLGLRFEEDLRSPYASALRLPKWFSNLLPEGPLREWIAEDRGVSLDREMELLAQVGHDLPGAVQVRMIEQSGDEWEWVDPAEAEDGRPATAGESPWRFSMAGVALKFSMLAHGDRLAVPAAGEFGDWLVKFPDYRHADVPVNEFTMMSLARAVGIDVPKIRLVHRDELRDVPPRMWPNAEEWAYAIRRFDRSHDHLRAAVHIEDFAQVRDKYPQAKYEGNFETVAALAYRGRDEASLVEVVRRIAFCVVVGNGDAHLKNWSLIYRNKKMPVLSPVYDLVATAPYVPIGESEDLGLKFAGSKRFVNVSRASFVALQNHLQRRLPEIRTNLADVAMRTVEEVRSHWPEHEAGLAKSPELRREIGDWVDFHSTRLLRSR